MADRIDEDKIKGFASDFKKIEDEISKDIIGQKDIIHKIIISMIADGNVLLEGLPGTGKTQLVKTVARVMDLSFSRIQFTPDLMPADVTGTNMMDAETGTVSFKKGPVFANIVLADEVNRATPKTHSALLEAMQEKTVTAGNTTYKLPDPFFVLATQNPLELEGTYPLPEAQLDRFIFKLDVKFPSKEELLSIVNITTGTRGAQAQKLFNADKIKEMRDMALEVPVADAVAEYAMNVIIKSHPELEASPEAVKKYVRYGSSPRGAQAIIKTARINALASGRYNVSYDDIKAVAYDVLRHRVFLNFDALSDGITVENIIDELIKE
ncbi:AAA family ATPase [Anaerotignum sp. MSJ-24]|uniref:AAA family ATPase n=1 Tax=Anaerotignum sp. MSJ-24 TaxID=2841521 RepID=UPI001C113E66|nr:AAA family ATPase [Anaerotignum sp. MSJ-24]MBD9220017.1 AAA family ATPase [Clostridiales bacterium]MBU5464119.1 AAA family ATPase [Anaerotignum sp. MSJ-24]